MQGRNIRKGAPAPPNFSLEGRGLSGDSLSFGGAAAGGTRMASSGVAGLGSRHAGSPDSPASMRSMGGSGVGSGKFASTRPLSPMQEGDSLAQEVDSELKFQGDLAKQNRERVEAMRAQLRKFQRETSSNAKEIKNLRAERFKHLQTEADLVNASLEEGFMDQEDAAREAFASKSFVVPHSDLPDIGAGTKGGVDPGTAEKTAKDEDRAKDELYPASDPDSDVESMCGRKGMLELAALAAREEATFMKVKTYKGSLFGPAGEEHMDFARESHLQPILHTVAGYSVRGRNNNVLWLASRKVVYTTGALAVVATPDAAPMVIQQDHFTKHSQEISAICVHPNGRTVATGEEAAEPSIYVWDSDDMEVLGESPLHGFHTRGIACLEFSKDGMFLFAVGRDTSHSISVYDWKMGTLICKEHADTRRRVLSMRCNPHDGLLVTVGVRHIKFWSLTIAMGQEILAAAPPISVWQKKLEPRRGVFGRHGISKSHTLLCVEFGGPGVTITGTRDGSLLIWKGVVLASWLQAHVGPIFSIWSIPAQGQTKLCTGGKDGSVGIWMFDWSLHLLYKPIVLPKEHKACIRSVCWHETMEKIVIGTAMGKILMVSSEPDGSIEWCPLARGHPRGPVRALAGHPDGSTFVTGGCDGKLLLWNIETGSVLSECKLPHGITYACYHKDGNKIACCMESGGGYLVSQTPQRKLVITSYRFCELVKSEITLARYSPDSDMIVCGFRSKVEIYNADSLKSKIGALVGHEGRVMNIDWSTDGKFLVSTSETYELLFWDRFTGRPIIASSLANLANPLNEITWATWTCNLGWAVQGLAGPNQDEFYITCVRRDTGSRLMLTGNTEGGVSLYPYPCPGTCYPVSPPRLHVGPVAQAIFLEGRDEEGAKEEGYIVSLGTIDTNVLMWRLDKAVPRVETMEEEEESDAAGKRAPEIERIIQESRAKTRVFDDTAEQGVTDEFEAVKPYLMSVCPRTEPVSPPEAFDWQVELQHLHGFQGAHGQASVFVIKCEVVYAAGASCVLHVHDPLLTPESARVNPQIQRHFTQHIDHIHCMACHPEGHFIASSDGQSTSSILVWEVDSLKVVARLPTDSNNVAHLKFSRDGSLLLAVSNEGNHSVSAWDWQNEKLLAIEDGDNAESTRILSVAVDPFGTAAQTTFITCGFNHVKFWNLEKADKRGYRLTSHRGNMEDDDAVSIMLCAAGCMNKGFVTGTDKGELFLWRSSTIKSIVLAHDGPIFALAENTENQLLCSASNDACIKLWNHQLQLLQTIELRAYLENTFLDLTQRMSNPSIFSLDWNSKDFGGLDNVLVGTASGEVFNLIIREEDVKTVVFYAHAHSSGRICGLCAHPSQMLFASGGDDKTLRIWELGEVPALFCMLTCQSIITSIDFSPSEGNLLAFGHDNGSIRILDVSSIGEWNLKTPVPCDGFLYSMQPPKKRKVPIEVLRFSPDAKYLVSGCTDGYIDVFSVEDEFKLVGVCKGHSGAISQLDFDAEGTHLQSNTWSDELKYWDIPACVEARRASDLCDSEWASFTCRLAWHVLESVPTGNESSLRSICRQNRKPASVFAAGFLDGSIQLMPFPAPEPEFRLRPPQKSSCRVINHMCYSHDDSFLIVAGGPDPVLEIYRHFEVQEIPSDDSDIRAIVSRPPPDPAHGVHSRIMGEEPQMGSVKSYLGALFAPSTQPFICPESAMPNYRLSLENVQSFRGHDTRHSLFFTSSGGIAFMACGMVVVHEGLEPRDAPRQRHFCEHEGELTCIAAHSNGTLIASAEQGKRPKILVWNLEDDYDEKKKRFRILATLAGVLVQGKMIADSVGISHVCFGGPNDKWLIALGLSEGCPLTLYEWQTSKLVTTVPIMTKLAKFLSMACNPIDHTIVTCGVKHLKFWTIKGEGSNLTAVNAFYGDRIVARTMCCIDFLLLGAYSLTVTGSIDGCIFVWKNEQLLTIVKEAHVGSIFDLAFDKINFLLFSAGRDGVLRTWSVDDHDGSLQEKGRCDPIHSATCTRCGYYTSAPAPGGIKTCPNCSKMDVKDVEGGLACIRSVSVRGQQVALGTSRGELVLVIPDTSPTCADVSVGLPKEMRVLVPSHGKGAVSVVEFHPIQLSLFFSVGDDCVLRMWDVEEKRLILSIRLADASKNVTATALHVSRDGRFVAVGFSNGHLSLLDCVGEEKKLMLQKASESNEFRVLRRGESISCLRFGASSSHTMLAAGTGDGLIHVFQDADGQGLRFGATCKGHIGKILSVDWSLDGAVMQSTSDEYQLLFWRLENLQMDPKEISEDVSFTERARLERPRLRCKLQRPMTCRDVEWPEWTSSLGWWVQGARKIAQEENSILSTHAPFDSSLCVFGDVYGHVSLLPFPCSQKSPLLHHTSIKTGPVKCVRLSPGEHDFVLAGSQTEGGLFMWRVEARGKKDLAAMGNSGLTNDQCWQRVMQVLTHVQSKGAQVDNQASHPSNNDENFLSSVHPYLSAIRQPLGWRASEDSLKMPDNELKLEYVFGYRGHDSTRNLFKIKNQELLYYVASVCVILNPRNERRTQRIFDKHRSDIERVALSPDCTTIASVSSGPRPKVFVWNSKSMKVLGHVDSKNDGKVTAMCFSGDGKVLALAVTNGETTSVAFYDWRHNVLLVEHEAQPWTILAFECNPLTGTFVTAGVRHVYFWRLSGRNLTIQMALVEQSQTLTTIAFLGENERSNTIVVGNTTGHLLLWREDKEAFGSMAPDEIIAAHSGPVFDTTTDENMLLTCSKGGEARIWKHEGRCKISCEHAVTIQMPQDSSSCHLCGKTDGIPLACLRSIVRIKEQKTGSYLLVVGTGNNSIYEAFVDETATTLEANVIMPSHSEGSIVGLASHPGKAIFATCGEDRSVKVWDREERIISRERHMEYEPTALTFSADGSRLVVGQSTGQIAILNSSTLEYMAGVDRAPKRKVRDLKFSPDGRFLAAASEDSRIYVYAIPLTRVFVSSESPVQAEGRDTLQLIGVCRGHSRSVVRLDWSSDGTRMQSESDDYDTILWDMSKNNKERYDPIRNAQVHNEIPWQTRDCLLTWHTSGLLSPVADFHTLLTSARSKLGDALAVGDCNGGLRLYRFPCASNDSRFRIYHGHSLGVSKVCFSYEDRHLISAGSRDQTIFVWHHLIIPGPEETDAIIDEMIRNKKHCHAKVAAKGGQVELDVVPAYLSKVVTPTTWNAEEALLDDGTELEITMEHVHGFRGAGRNQNIRNVGQDEILYLAAMLLVIMDLKTRRQRFFRKHEHDITCFAVHPGGEMIASADSGQSGKVLVWNVKTMNVVSLVSTLPKQSACALCFSQDGNLLFCAMDNQENTVLCVEWESNKKAALEKGGANQVLAIASHPDGDVVVTCGYKHVKFWTVEKGHMYSTNGTFGAGKPQTMICIEFTKEDEGVQPMTLTGAQNGCIYMWREHHLHRIIVAHSSPILDMFMTFDGVVTCGIDGLVRLWSAEWTSCARLDVAELTRGLQGYSAGVMTPVQSVLLLKEEDAQSEMRRFVVGMESNEVYIFIFNGNPEEVDVLPETQILVQGHATGALCQVCAHPSLQEFATIGHDQTLRTWDCEQYSPIIFVRLPGMGSALTYFPDGKSLAAGLTNGTVLRIDCESAKIESAKIETILQKRTKTVTRIKFSPSGKLLAVGYENGIIDVLDAGAVCLLIFSCKAIGSIEQVDFSTDEHVLQCSTSAMDLSFWNLSSHPGKQISRPAEFRDKSWATWTSRFGFAVQALSPTVREITSVQKGHGPLLLTALTSGRFAAYRYPAIGESVEGKSFHAHLAPMADLCLTTGDQRLISIGMTDCSIVQWKVSLLAPETTRPQNGSDVPTELKKDALVGTRIVFFFLDYVFDEWESKMEDVFITKLAKLDSNLSKEGIKVVEALPGSVILKVQITSPRISKVMSILETDHRNPVGHLRKDLKVVHLITDEDIFFSAYRPKPDSTYLSRIPTVEVIPEISQDPDLQKPYISTSFQPNVTSHKDTSSIPVKYLELEHVHGFAGFNRIGNLFYVQTGEVLFTVATVAVVHDVDTGRQCFFRKHTDEIVAVTLHKDRQLVATGDNGSSSTIFVWSSVTMEALMRLNANPMGSVVSVCFSSDSTRLIVVSEIAEAIIEIFEW